MIAITALYLIYHLALGQYGVLFEGYREGHWWQYLISILMFAFGIVFMYAGKVKTIVFDKEAGLLTKQATSIFCKSEAVEWPIE